MAYTPIFRMYGPDVDMSFDVSRFDEYFIVFEASIKSFSYSATVEGTRRVYKTEDLKLSCSSEEHFGNCIVNDNKTEDFCVVIDYDAPEGSEEVEVDVAKTKKRRGEDEVIPHSDSGSKTFKISSSSSSVYHESSASTTVSTSGSSSSNVSVSSSGAGSASGGLLSEVSDLTSLSDDDDSNTYIVLGILAIVAGSLLILLGIGFAAYTYVTVYRKNTEDSDDEEEEDGNEMTSVTTNPKEDPEVDTNATYPAQSPSDIPTNVAVSASAPPPPPPPSAPSLYPTFDDNPSYPAAPQQDQAYPSAPPPPPGSY